jgi:NAD(P)-dependent dehydrogenase (short-subunit alcohol dehydrogenase family)
MGKLKDKVAIVTGATSGIGLGVVTSFLKEDAKVVFCGRRKEKGEAIVADFKKEGYENVTFVQADVTVISDIERLFQTALSTYGKLDILVNNAGMMAQFAIEDMDIEKDLDRVLSLNLRSYFITTKYAAKEMKAGASIINMASVGGIGAAPYLPSYGATKAGVLSLTKSMAKELGPKGIRTNAISPGTIYSEMMQPDSEFTKQSLNLIPLGRGGEPSEIGSVAAFLASDEASYINGANIVVDGGMIV